MTFKRIKVISSEWPIFFINLFITGIRREYLPKSNHGHYHKGHLAFLFDKLVSVFVGGE